VGTLRIHKAPTWALWKGYKVARPLSSILFLTCRTPRITVPSVKPKNRTRKPQAETLPDLKAEETQSGATGELQEEKSASRVSINWYVTEDGKIDTSRMRESMKQRIREVLPELSSEFGEKEQAQAAEAIEVIPEAWVSTFYDVFGSFEALVFGKLLKVDQDIASRIFSYSEAEKEKLVPPTARIINKYAPDWLLRYKDEIALGMLIVMMTSAKIAAAKMMANVQEKMRTAKSPVPSADAKPNGRERESPKQAEEPEKTSGEISTEEILQ
jgi:hypothetical protein